MSPGKDSAATSTIGHNVETGALRLLNAPKDLIPPGAPRPQMRSREEASPEYRALFDAYRAEMRPVVDAAVAWWTGIVDRSESGGLSRADAVRENMLLRPAGPASFPQMVAAVRKYWLKCDDLNRTLGDSRAVAPEQVLVGWLSTKDDAGLLQIITAMPYWPLGLDAAGHWS